MNASAKGTLEGPVQRGRRGIAGGIYLAAIGVLLMLVGSVFSVALWRGYRKAGETLRWKQTPCEIVSTWIGEGKFSEAGDRRYRLELRYRYEFAGREYVGNRIRRRDGETRYREKLERQLTAYRPGTKTLCYVDPEAPSVAVLQHDTRAPGYSLWFPFLFVGGGAVMAWRAACRIGNCVSDGNLQ